MSKGQRLAILCLLLGTTLAAHGESEPNTIENRDKEQSDWRLARISENAFESLASRWSDEAKSGLVARCAIFGRDTKRLMFPNKWRTNNAHCYPLGGKQEQKFARAVAKTAARLHATGANYDGEDVFTEIYFSVVLTNENGQPSIEVFPNWSYDAAIYGDSYEAPQRVIDWNGPFSVASKCAFDGLVQSIVDINADGEAHGPVRFEFHEGRLSDACSSMLEKYILESRFIPAHYDGRPVQAYHAETWF